MNAAKAIETAVCEVLRKCAEMGTVELRAWQSLPESIGASDYKRKFPCVDVRASPQAADDNAETLTSLVTILCATQTDDDRTHAKASDIYDAVQGAIDRLVAQQHAGTAGTDTNEIGVFGTSLTASMATVTLGGFTFADGYGPTDDDGLNVIGFSFTVHFSRSDW